MGFKIRMGQPEMENLWNDLSTRKRLGDETKFYAAVGLAQLGEADGFTWLIKNSENQLPTVSKAWPGRVSNHNLDTCSVAALRDLSGGENLKSKKEWESWWESVDRKRLPKAHMSVEDS